MKRHLPMALALVLLALACVPAWASDGEIAIVTDDVFGANECNYWVMKHRGKTDEQKFGSCVGPGVLSVYAELGGASAGGISGAEYAVSFNGDSSPDPGYLLIEIPNLTATTILGSAFTPPDPSPRGIGIAWNSCQSGTDGRVLLANVIVIPTAACGPSLKPPPLDMLTVEHSSPSNVFFRCPLFTLCDGPVFTKVCLGSNIVDCQTQVPPFPIASKCSTSGGFGLNAQNPGKCTPTKAGVAVNSVDDTQTWSTVKDLYR